MEKGKFIVFEGIDGSGKTTQMRLLGDFLRERGMDVVLTQEPTHSPIGSLLRSCLGGGYETDERVIAALFAADRIDHITAKDGIRALLDRGTTVLCDRYYPSSLAYNGGLVSFDWVYELNRPAIGLLPPDLVLFLDVTPEESMARLSRRSERERYEQAELQRKLRDRYFEAFAKTGDRVAVVKSERDKFKTQENIQKTVLEFLGEQV